MTHTTRPSRLLLAGAMALLIAGIAMLVGCSSDSDTVAPPPAMDTEQGLQRMQGIAQDALDMQEPGNIALDDETIAALMAMMAELGFELPTNGDIPDFPPVGNIDEYLYGLHVWGSWNVNEAAMNATADLRVTGTVQDTDSDMDGVAVDLTVAIRIAGGNGTATVTGTVAEPGGAPRDVNLRATISDAGSNKRVRVEARVRERGVELFFADVTAIMDPLGDDDSATLNGTVRIIDPDNAPHRITLTLTNLSTNADGELAAGGRVVMVDSLSGLTSTLTVQPDGSLAGPVSDNRGVVVGYMTVVDGVATVTPV